MERKCDYRENKARMPETHVQSTKKKTSGGVVSLDGRRGDGDLSN